MKFTRRVYRVAIMRAHERAFQLFVTRTSLLDERSVYAQWQKAQHTKELLLARYKNRFGRAWV